VEQSSSLQFEIFLAAEAAIDRSIRDRGSRNHDFTGKSIAGSRPNEKATLAARLKKIDDPGHVCARVFIHAKVRDQGSSDDVRSVRAT
jgi:hypothetical protein